MPGILRCAYGFLSAFRRSLTATSVPMCPGAPDRRMYSRMCGAKYPPAPTTSEALNGRCVDSAHVALDSDCFSNATTSTRSCTPPWMSEAPTSPVEPPTLPAVWTRVTGLPAAPSASARYASGIMTPSNRSGALPMTTASMSLNVSSASSRARRAASRTSPAIETSRRFVWYLVCPTPMTAQRFAMLRPPTR